MDEFSRKLELLKLASQFAENESDRGAGRHRSFLFVNTGLIAALSLAPEPILKISGLFLAFLGAVTSFVWLRTVPLSHFYERRWIEDQKHILESDPELIAAIKGRHAPRCNRPGRSFRTLDYWQPWAFVLFWSAVFLVSLLAGLEEWI